jgi:hypothetical protein
MKNERARRRSEKRRLNTRKPLSQGTEINYESLMDGKDSCYVVTAPFDGKPMDIVLQTRENIYSKGFKMRTTYQGFLPNGESILVGKKLVRRIINKKRFFRY